VGRTSGSVAIGCGPINRLSDVFADPHVQARAMVREVPHSSAPEGKVRVVANPVRLSATPPDYRRGPPLLGEHTEDVLGELLGLDEEKIAELKAKGVIG
jgi:crotonobetainyl-CoA:carnitine CoA-transferase CaiB-like acyl-CoA transferase